MILKPEEYYFWGEGFGTLYQHHIDYLVRLNFINPSISEQHKLINFTILKGYSSNHWMIKADEERKVGEDFTEQVFLEKISNYVRPVNLEDIKTWQPDDYEEIVELIRFDKVYVNIKKIVLEETFATSHHWIELKSIFQKLIEMKLEPKMDDIAKYLSQKKNWFILSEDKKKILHKRFQYENNQTGTPE